MHHVSSILGALTVGALFAVACSSGSGLSSSDAPETVAEISCTAYFDCNCPDVVQNPFTSEDECRLQTAADVQRAVDEGEDAGLSYDADCVGRAANAIDSLDCATLTQAFVDVGLQRSLDDLGCKAFFGDKAAGAACSNLTDSNGDDCLPDLDCVGDVCRPMDIGAPEGEPCEMTQDCDTGLVCFDVTGGNAPKCEALPVNGETCKGMADLCSLDLWCDQTNKTCRPLPAAGEPCSASPGVLGQTCAAFSYCDMDTCVASPAGGEDCTAQTGCAEGFLCVGQVCRVEAALVCAFPLVTG